MYRPPRMNVDHETATPDGNFTCDSVVVIRVSADTDAIISQLAELRLAIILSYGFRSKRQTF